MKSNTSPIIEAERTSKKYAEHYFETEREMSGLFALDTRILDSLISKGSVLDAMMGPGRHAVHLARRGMAVHGNDFNRHMVAIARQQLRKEKLKAILTNYDVTNLSRIKGGSFGYVICMYNALGSIPGRDKRQKALSEMARVCRKGGLVIVHCHNLLGDLTTLGDWGNLLSNFLRKAGMESGDVITHDDYLGETFQHLFTVRELSSLFANADLRIEKRFFLRGYRQASITKGPFREFLSGGFIFVGRKIS